MSAPTITYVPKSGAYEVSAGGAVLGTPRRVSVCSYVRRDGAKTIIVKRSCPATHQERQEHLKSLEARGIIQDWQASHHADVAEARSCIMQMYGIGWFNMARAQLAAVAKAGG